MGSRVRVAFALNADALQISKRLWVEPSVRASLVSQPDTPSIWSSNHCSTFCRNATASPCALWSNAVSAFWTGSLGILRGNPVRPTDARAVELPQLAAAVAEGSLELEDVVTHTSRLDGVQEALDRLRRGEGARTVLAIDRELAEGLKSAGASGDNRRKRGRSSRWSSR